jgi:uncharacterized protein
LTLPLVPYILCAAAAGMLIGFSKTAIPGLGLIVVTLMTVLFEVPGEAMGAMLLMLIVGDVFAVRFYHHHADWALLIRLIPWVLVGIGIGTWVAGHLSKAQHQYTLGGMVIGLTAFEALRQWKQWNAIPRHLAITIATGILAGIATTVGNAAGPILGVYLLSQGFKKEKFMGTGAWYFLILNCVKIPSYLLLDWITPQTLAFDLMVAPAIIGGALFGLWALPRISQSVFTRSVLILGAIGGAYLLAKPLLTKPAPTKPEIILPPALDDPTSHGILPTTTDSQ